MGRGKESSLADLVKGIISGLDKKERFSEEEICEVWEGAVGKAAAKHTRPVSLKKAVLKVNVDGSSWLYELTVRKRDILKSLGERLRGKKIKEIRFRIGEVKANQDERKKEKG